MTIIHNTMTMTMMTMTMMTTMTILMTIIDDWWHVGHCYCYMLHCWHWHSLLLFIVVIMLLFIYSHVYLLLFIYYYLLLHCWWHRWLCESLLTIDTMPDHYNVTMMIYQWYQWPMINVDYHSTCCTIAPLVHHCWHLLTSVELLMLMKMINWWSVDQHVDQHWTMLNQSMINMLNIVDGDIVDIVIIIIIIIIVTLPLSCC